MKAVVFDKPGGPEVLDYREVPDPHPKPGEAVVQIRSAAVNAADLWVRRPGMDVELPHISGSDGAGEVVAVNGPSPFRVGDPVVINPALPSGDPATVGLGPYRDIVNILGYDTQGTYAEFVAVPSAQLFRKPDRLSYEEAAAFPLTFLTAWRMLASRAQVHPGERVFVWGATGGLGSAAIKIAKHLGAIVYGAVGSDEDGGTILASGADYAVNYRRQPDEAVRELTAGEGVDVVFDSVGGTTWKTTLSILRPGGRIAIAGTTAGDVVEHDLSDVFYYQWSILGCRMGNAEEFGQVVRMLDTSQVRPIVGAVFDLREAAEAQRTLENSDFVGKIALRV